MRQFLKLMKGDVVDIRNYKSNIGSVNTSINSGGHEVGHPVNFMGFRLSPLDECEYDCNKNNEKIKP
jgi:hypothetical protein